MNRNVIIILFIIVLFPLGALADTIELNSGKTMAGTITEIREGYVYITTPRGDYRVRQDKIRRITRSPSAHIAAPVVKTPSPVAAEKRTVSGLLSLGGRFGYSTFALGSVNDAIGHGNTLASEAGFSGNVPKITSGYPFSFDIRYGMWKGIAVSCDFTYLQTSTSGSYSYAGGSESITEDISSYALSFLGVYVEPFGDFNLYGGAGLTLYMGSRDEVGISQTWGSGRSGSSIVYESDGLGTGGLAMGGIEYLIIKSFAVGIDIGYRYAPLGQIRAGSTGQTALMYDGSPRDLDLSGFWAMLGIRFYVRPGAWETPL